MRRFLLLLPCLLGTAFDAAPLKLRQNGDTGNLVMSQAGKTLWSRPLRGGPYQYRSELGPKVAPVGLVGNVAYAVYCWQGQRLYCQTAGFHKRTGKSLFDLEGTPQAIGQGEMLTNFWGVPTDISFDVVDGYRVNTTTGKAERVGFRIPPRPGCGSLNYTIGLPTRYDAQYAYAQQDDECGVFEARFDWHGPQTQEPVLRVIRREPVKR